MDLELATEMTSMARKGRFASAPDIKANLCISLQGLPITGKEIANHIVSLAWKATEYKSVTSRQPTAVAPAVLTAHLNSINQYIPYSLTTSAGQ